MGMDVLRKQLKSKDIKKSYLFHGPERYLIEYYLEEMKKILIPEGTEVFNFAMCEGSIQTSKISDLCDTMPVFSDKRMVVLKETGYFKGGKGPVRDELIDVLENLTGYCCVVFIEGSIDKRLKAVKQIKKTGLIVEFPYQKNNNLMKWIDKAVKNYGKTIDGNASHLLIEYCEPGMNNILKELEKVLLYIGEKNSISTGDIRSACTKSLKTRVFDLLDSVFEKDISKAFTMLDEMITLREPVPKILFLVARQFKLLIRAKELKSNRMSKYDIVNTLGVHPFVAEKVMKQAGGFSSKRLKKLVEMCLQTDFDIKTGRISDRLGLELLIAAIAV